MGYQQVGIGIGVVWCVDVVQYDFMFVVWIELVVGIGVEYGFELMVVIYQVVFVFVDYDFFGLEYGYFFVGFGGGIWCGDCLLFGYWL